MKFGASDVAAMKLGAADVSRVYLGASLVWEAGGAAGSRFSQWTGSYSNGDILQFDRPAGLNVPLSGYSAYQENVEQTMTTAGTSVTNPTGNTFAIGGRPDTVGGVLIETANRILCASITAGSAPLSSDDRATLTAFMQGLRSGAIE